MDSRLRAVAKINLYLDVLRRRPDGYHDIATVFLPLEDPADEIAVAAAAPGELRVTSDHAGVPDGPGNLCWRAADAFARDTGIAPSWEIAIRKRIPVAAGLGGGSSDAAAVLLGLNRRHGNPLSLDRLRRLAVGLGADVAFFLEPSPALGEGLGEVLRALPCRGSLEVVLANPGFPIAAAWAYANRARVPVPPAPALAPVLAALADPTPEALAPLTYNALEPAILDKFPMVAMLCRDLREAGCLCSHVSGSGPTVYGLCRAGQGEAIRARLQERYGAAALWTCATRSLASPPGVGVTP